MPSALETIFDNQVCYHLLSPPGSNSTGRYPYLLFGEKFPLLGLIFGIFAIVFVLYLLLQVCVAVKKLRRADSLIVTTYYVFVWSVCVFNLLRIAMFSFTPHIKEYIAIPYIIAGAILVFIEVSVVIFMCHRNKVSGKHAIKRTAIIALFIVILNLIVQTVLIFAFDIQVFDHYDVNSALYWIVRHSVFVAAYLVLLIIPCTQYKDWLPASPAFYHYVRFLLTMNLAYGLGELLIYLSVNVGYCFVILSLFLNYGALAPMLYFCFLYGLLKEVRLPHEAQELLVNGLIEGEKTPLLPSFHVSSN